MKRVLLIGVVILFAFQTIAQDTLSKKEKRKLKANFLLSEKKWSAELPIWVPGFAGYFSYGDASIEGGDGMDPVQPIEPPDGIFDGVLERLFKTNWYLRFLFITKLSYEPKNFYGSFEAMSINVGNSVKFRTNTSSIADAYFRVIYSRITLGYKIYETSNNNKFKYKLYIYTGARIFHHQVKSDINNTNIDFTISPTKTSPILGIMNKFLLKRWKFIFQADYDPMMFNNNSSLQFTFNTYYKTGGLTSLKFGWNHLNLNNKGHFNGEEYIIKATFSGPALGVAFGF